MNKQGNPFLQALQHGLGRSQEAFAQADAEFREVVAEVSEAISSYSKGALRLAVDPTHDLVEGRHYDVDVLGDIDDKPRTVVNFFVPSRGYPIGHGARKGPRQGVEFEPDEWLGDMEDIRNFFEDSLANPDSALSTYIAYKMRPKVEGEDDKDDLPF